MSDTERRDAVLKEYRPAAGERVSLLGVAYLENPVKVFDMADEIRRLRDENAALTAAVERVRALHHNRMRGAYACAECRDDYPCPTLRALEGTP